MSQSALNTGTEDFKRALLDGPNGLRDIQSKLRMHRDNLEDDRRAYKPRDETFEARKKSILTLQRKIEVLKRQVEHLKRENVARKRNIQHFGQFVSEREDSIRNIETIEKTIVENKTKKVSLVERR